MSGYTGLGKVSFKIGCKDGITEFDLFQKFTEHLHNKSCIPINLMLLFG